MPNTYLHGYPTAVNAWHREGLRSFDEPRPVFGQRSARVYQFVQSTQFPQSSGGNEYVVAIMLRLPRTRAE